MSDCARFEEMLSLERDGRLNRDEQQELQSHLESCPVCRDLHHDYRALGEGLRRLPLAKTPDSARLRLAEQVAEQRRAQVQARLLRNRRLNGLAWAAVLAFLLCLGWLSRVGVRDYLEVALSEAEVRDGRYRVVAEACDGEFVPGATTRLVLQLDSGEHSSQVEGHIRYDFDGDGRDDSEETFQFQTDSRVGFESFSEVVGMRLTHPHQNLKRGRVIVELKFDPDAVVKIAPGSKVILPHRKLGMAGTPGAAQSTASQWLDGLLGASHSPDRR